MALNIEDYALISDCYTAALIGKDGSIDWLCMPRYDSPSMFGALLGTKEHGRWLLAPTDEKATSSRRYDGNTFVLKTNWSTADGEVEITELMPHSNHRADIVRRVRGIRGSVELHQDVRIRFGYNTVVPWVRKLEEKSPRALVAVAGPDAIVLRGPELKASGSSHHATFTVNEGETIDISMTWYPSHREPPEAADVDEMIKATSDWWNDWADKCNPEGPYRDAVTRSLLVLRALTHEETGGIVAAATTSLPEDFGGSRNWDYRYVWLRDASLTLEALLSHGINAGIERWRAWLLRAIAGDPADVQIMYGLSGERFLPEQEQHSLPGYQGASPVRVGNAAALQFQADVIGEVMVALHAGRVAGVKETKFSWSLQRALLGFMEKNWQKPDQGIWEIRGNPQAFTQSRVMVWAAFDRGVKGITEFGHEGPLEKWSALRDEIREQIESKGFDKERGTYTQYFGTSEVDASLLQLVQVGYCKPDDPRMLGTVEAIEHDLLRGGLLMRYRTSTNVDGLPGNENPFLACSFWLVAQYAQTGRLAEAKQLMERLLSFSNDLGLLSEEYDAESKRQAGNTPQAFSHLALVRAADAITAAENAPENKPSSSDLAR